MFLFEHLCMLLAALLSAIVLCIDYAAAAILFASCYLYLDTKLPPMLCNIELGFPQKKKKKTSNGWLCCTVFWLFYTCYIYFGWLLLLARWKWKHASWNLMPRSILQTL